MQNAVFNPLARFAHAVLVAAFALLFLGAAAGLAPEPDPIPRRWQLDVEMGPLRVANIDLPGGSKAFYYLTYKVTNNTGSDLLFAPAFDLSTSDGGVIRSGRDVPAQVTRSLMESLGNPLLEDQIGIIGMLLQGEENAKDGLVIWPADDLRITEISVYSAGFSGETRMIEVRNPNTGQNDRVILRKTLMTRYAAPGETTNRGTRPFSVLEQRWILR